MHYKLLPVLLALLAIISSPSSQSGLLKDGFWRNALASHDVKDEVAFLSIGYPFSKNNSVYTIFLNRKKVARINQGERIIIQLKGEASYAVSIDEQPTYKEPSTLSSNSRTISVKQGKHYYFLITNKMQLEYQFNPASGEKAFNKSGDYNVTEPTTIGISQTSVMLIMN